MPFRERERERVYCILTQMATIKATHTNFPIIINDIHVYSIYIYIYTLTISMAGNEPYVYIW